MKEGTDYVLIEPDRESDPWHARILTGEFPETVIRFGAIALNEKIGALSFNFAVISSPDPEAVVENVALQNVAHDVLQSVFDVALEEGFARVTDRETGKEIEYWKDEYRTNDTTESSD
jgi:hypothetical protein